MTGRDALYVCPACRGDLAGSETGYDCLACGRSFPLVLGIPDFRIASDPWLPIAEDREKAARLAARAGSAGFAELLRFYWSITPGTRDDLAGRFIAHALAGEARGERRREEIGMPVGSRLLDLGCGTGGLMVAAARRGDRVAGVDVALRWLVVARRRLREAGVEAEQVCANAEWLPFADQSFDAVAGLGLLEHAADPERVVSEAGRVLRDGGRALFTAVNRWAPTPEPHLRLWGVGYLPRRVAIAYARMRRGVPYERVRPLSRPALRRLFRGSPFDAVTVAADPIPPPEAGGPSAAWGPLVRAYELARNGPSPARALLSRIAPVLQVRAVRTLRTACAVRTARGVA